jgi:hypothetical protein
MKAVVVAVAICCASILYMPGCVNPGKTVAPSVPVAQEITQVKEPANSVDYLVVYGDQLHDAAASFAAYRKSSSCSTAIVGYNIVASAFPATTSDRPLRSFLNYIDTSWGRVPKHVLILGSAGVHGVPAADTLIEGWDSTCSDGGTDSLLTFSIGRIPCATNGQALAVLDKIKKFESALPNKIKFVVDNSTGSDPLQNAFPDAFHFISPMINGTSFSQDSFIVGDFGSDTMIWTTSESSQAKTALFQFLNSGNGYISYWGHGNNARLSDRNLLNSSDVVSLSAINVYVLCGSFITDFTRDTLLAGALLFRQNSGAVAVIGNSYYQYLSDEEKFQTEMLSRLTQGKYTELGTLFKASAQNRISNKTKMLLGDPAMVIRR